MKIESQVCSLELAKKLKTLGVKQESLFHYMRNNRTQVYKLGYGYSGPFETADAEPIISAFTVAELGEMLPGNLDGDILVTQKGMMGRLWYCTQKTHDLDSDRLLDEHQEEADTEANARAKMLCYLLENGLTVV